MSEKTPYTIPVQLFESADLNVLLQEMKQSRKGLSREEMEKILTISDLSQRVEAMRALIRESYPPAPTDPSQETKTEV